MLYVWAFHFPASIIGSNIYKVPWVLSICKNCTMQPLLSLMGATSQLFLLLLGCKVLQTTFT